MHSNLDEIWINVKTWRCGKKVIRITDFVAQRSSVCNFKLKAWLDFQQIIHWQIYWVDNKYVRHNSMRKNDQTNWRKQQHLQTYLRTRNLYIKLPSLHNCCRYHQHYGKWEREVSTTEMEYSANHIWKSFTLECFSLLHSKRLKCCGWTHSLPCNSQPC